MIQQQTILPKPPEVIELPGISFPTEMLTVWQFWLLIGIITTCFLAYLYIYKDRHVK